MTIAVTPEQEALRDASRRWAERHCSSESVRALVEAERVDVHDLLRAAGEQGLLGIHVGEEYGGGGGSLVDLAVVLEEFGRALVPGQVVPTVLAALVLERNGGDAAAELLPALVAGEVAVGCGWEVRVADFGLAKELGDAAPEARSEEGRSAVFPSRPSSRKAKVSLAPGMECSLASTLTVAS